MAKKPKKGARPYSLQFTAQGKPVRYLLSGIPPTLWRNARARAKRENVAMRTLILALVKTWTDRPEGAPTPGIAPAAPPPAPPPAA
jgi:hypothetical protein